MRTTDFPAPGFPGAPDELTTLPAGPRLRRWRATDAGAVRDAFRAPLMERQAPEPVEDLSAAHRWLGEREEEWAAGRAFSWAVLPTGSPTDPPVGCVRLGAVERRHGTAWVSYWAVPAARGRGITTAALRAVCGAAFGPLGLYRLELGHRTDNPASCGVARGAGFAVEGVERGKLLWGGRRYDVELHARLADDPSPGTEGDDTIGVGHPIG
ncbi:GNAT family N-acetyltransferase [Streptomyces sp. ST2-7A]|uniref:GNAT family N-acetyltransferase n=1 Tax=Streptomyces sp. ST2-7A TaxID=2907214 RepID=UPI001F35FAA0|nr:GNAT family protein [Streptomyces sp. ST2-7A]MCE7082282.1 GNAT family N-acetyltransferase [Streptomyces sp. ST2-7A]